MVERVASGLYLSDQVTVLAGVLPHLLSRRRGEEDEGWGWEGQVKK